MKRFISFLTAFSITLMLLSGSPNIAEAATTGGCNGSHNGYQKWINYYPSGNFYLDSDHNMVESIIISGDLTLCLNGHTLTAITNNRLIFINEGCTLTICDCKGTGKLIGSDISGNGSNLDKGGVICIAGTLIMNGGTITGNEAIRSGGGVNLATSGATFNMNGGTISKNTAGIDGSGVNISPNSTFTMTGGTITGNEAKGTQGGAIWFDNTGTLTLNGNVNITGNTKNGSASNVYADGGTITIGSNFSTSSKVGILL